MHDKFSISAYHIVIITVLLWLSSVFLRWWLVPETFPEITSFVCARVRVCVCVRVSATVSFDRCSKDKGLDNVFAHVTSDVISTRAHKPRGKPLHAHCPSQSLSHTRSFILHNGLNFLLKARNTQRLITFCPLFPQSFVLFFSLPPFLHQWDETLVLFYLLMRPIKHRNIWSTKWELSAITYTPPHTLTHTYSYVSI